MARKGEFSPKEARLFCFYAGVLMWLVTWRDISVFAANAFVRWWPRRSGLGEYRGR